MEEKQPSASEVDERTGLKKKPPIGYLMGLMNHLKFCIGSGVFALGFALKNAGMAIGPPLFVVLGFIQLHCQHVLMDSGKEIEKHLGKRPDFAEAGRGVFQYGPERLRRYQKVMQIASNTILILNQAGILCVYIVFFSDSMMRVAENWEYTDIGIQIWVLIAFPPIIITTSTLGNLKLVGGLSLFANCLLLVGILVTIYATTTNLPEKFTFEWIGDLTKLPMFISVCFLTISSTPVILPLYIESKNSDQLDSFFGVLNVATFIEIWACLVVGILSYMKYGKECKGSITLNLEIGGLSQTVVILVGVSVMLSYTINMYIVIEAIFPLISEKWGPLRYPNLGKFCFRLGCIVATFIVSWSMPMLGQIIALVGAFGYTTITVIFPVIFHLVIMWDKSSAVVKVKDCAIIFLGLFTLVAGIIAAIRDIVSEIDKVYNPISST